jgi:dihydroxyacetone kinase-like protein
MKKLINDPSAATDEALEGFALAHGDLVVLEAAPRFVRRRNQPIGKVGLISGGGSGHDPLHAGFIGVGMLDAAVPGEIFSSPSPDPIVAALSSAQSGAGVLQIVKNYTGDILNFEMAAELAASDGIDVRTVVVDDDVAVERSTFTAGRRGVAGTMLVEKIAGAAAERGDTLDEVEAVARRVVERVRTMGVALTPCTVPHAGVPSFELDDNEIEIGIGMHGEPGRERIPLEPANAIVERLLGPILDDLGASGNQRALLLVNGMGSTPLMELYIVLRHANAVLTARGIDVTRVLVGEYVTALDMAGCSISVLLLDDALTELWDAPVHTPALRWGV